MTRSKLPNPCKVGDIFCWSWGYDQSNIDFFQVVAVRGGDVIVREIEQEIVATNDADYFSSRTEYVVARSDCFLEDGRGDPRRKRVQFTRDGEPYLKIESYGWCTLWDGSKQYVSHSA